MTQNPKTERKILMPDVDIDALLDQEVEYDPEVEKPFEAPPPPPDGRHAAILSLGRGQGGNEPITVRPAKKEGGSPFLMVAVAAKLNEPGEAWDGLYVYDNAMSIIGRNGTSTIHEILKVAGNPAPRSTSLRDLKTRMEEVLSGNCSVEIETEWEASCEDPAKPGSKEYITAKRGMRNFPKDSEGNPIPEIEYRYKDASGSLQSVMVKARAIIKGYYAIA